MRPRGAYAALSKYEESLEDASYCVKLKPDWPKGYSRRALAQLQLRRPKEAVASYRIGLQLDPTNEALRDGLQQAQAAVDAEEASTRQRMAMMVASLLQLPKFKAYADEDSTFSERLTVMLEQVLRDPKNLQLAMAVCPDPRVKEALSELLGLPSAENEAGSEPQPAKRTEASRKTSETPGAPVESEADQWKAKGNALYKEKKFEEALEAYDKAIALNPNDITYLNNKAAVYLEMKKYDECLSECQKALDMRYEVRADFERVAKVYNRMAMCYRRQQNYTKAIEMYEKSLLEDNNRHTRAALADVKRLKEKKDIEDYIDPELAEQHRAKGNDHFRENRFPEAKQEYDEAIRRNPHDAALYANRAAALMKLLELPMALKDAEKSLELDPNVPKVWARKGNIHALMKEYNKALNAYQSGLKIDPESAQCKQGLDNVLMKIQEQTSSDTVDEEQIKHAMADPEIQRILADPQFCLLLGEISKNPGKLAEALKDPHIAGGIQKLMAAGILKIA